MASDGFFALNAEEGDDSVDASPSTLPLVIFGGEGNDTIDAGQGNDVVFGDKGRVDYRDGSGKLITRLGLGLGERNVLQPGDVEASEADVPFQQTNGVALPPILITTRETAVGGADEIYGNAGDDVILSGAMGDTVHGKRRRRPRPRRLRKSDGHRQRCDAC